MIFVSTMDTLAQHLGVASQHPLVVERAGRPFEIRYFSGGKHQSASLQITMSVDEAFGAPSEEGRARVEIRPAIVFRKETAIDRFGKRIKFNREVQTGDAIFDGSVYVETDSPERDVRAVLSAEKVRGAVRALANATGQAVALDRKGLTIRCSTSGEGTTLGERVDRLLGLMTEAGSALPLFEPGQAQKPASGFLRNSPLILTMLAFPVIVVSAGKPPIDGGALPLGVGMGSVIAVLCIAAAVATLRGRSDSLRRIVNISIAALFIPLSTYKILCWMNRAFDSSPAVDHPTTIAKLSSDVHTSQKGSSSSYEIDVTSWRPGGGPISLAVTSDFFKGAKTGRAMVVSTHAGMLGWEWVDGYRYK